MQREPEYYVGSSRCFRITSRQHIQVNLALCRVPIPAPVCRPFCGCVYDGCTGERLDDVYVSVKYHECQYRGYTDAKGRFCFFLPPCADAVSIALWKCGYYKGYIGFYPIDSDCSNNFCLYRIE